MTKEEKIKEVYGEYWKSVKEFVDENGRLKVLWGSIFHYPQYENLASSIQNMIDVSNVEFEGEYYARPKSLQGIEDNNGWKDLPTKEFLEQGFYFVKIRQPLTEYEEIFVHEIKNSAGIIPYHYAMQYKKIELKLPLH